MIPIRLGTYPTVPAALLNGLQALLADGQESSVVADLRKALIVCYVAYTVGTDTKQLDSWPRQPLAGGSLPSLERVQDVDGTATEGRGVLYHEESEQG